MRRRALLGGLVGLTLALAACGEEPASTAGGPGDARFEIGDAQTVPSEPAECPAGAPLRLDAAAKAVRVADLEERRGAAPDTLVTADDLTLECVRWSSWGGATAEGEAVARLLNCVPTCANGTEERVPARLVLGEPRECEGRRWYTTATVRLERKGDDPASYLRAPC